MDEYRTGLSSEGVNVKGLNTFMSTVLGEGQLCVWDAFILQMCLLSLPFLAILDMFVVLFCCVQCSQL